MIIALKDYISNNTNNGYFVFLGFISWVEPTDTSNINHPNSRGILEPDGISQDCFGMGAEFEDSGNENPALSSTVQWVIDSVNNPYGVSGLAIIGKKFGFDKEIDFSLYPSGYYGFIYIDGDTNLNSIQNDGECSSLTCFEVEILNPFPTLNQVSLNICEIDITSGDVDLLALLLTDVFNNANYVAGGIWTQVSGPPLGAINATTGLVTSVSITSGAVYVFEYILNTDYYPTYHTLDHTCTLQTGIVALNIEPFDLGDSASIVACNICTIDGYVVLQEQSTGTVDPTGVWTDSDMSGASIIGNSINLTGVTAGVYIFTYTIDGTSGCAGGQELAITVVDPPANPGTQNYCSFDTTLYNIFAIGGNPGLIPFVLGSLYQVYIDGVVFPTGHIQPSAIGVGTFVFKVCLLRSGGILVHSSCECCIEFTVEITDALYAGVDATVSLCN